MAALSHLARSAGSRFVYFTKPLPAYLKTTSVQGNLATALSNGMEIIEVRDGAEYQRLVGAAKLSSGFPTQASLPPGIQRTEDVFWVPQGGACPEAELGCQRLASQVTEYIATSSASAGSGETGKPRRWMLVMASGTGTTAMFTARALEQQLRARVPSSASSTSLCEVVAVPCAGGSADLLQQMEALDSSSGLARVFPRLLLENSDAKRVFAKPYAEHLSLWRELCFELQVVVPFDLIYAPRAFEVLLASPDWRDSEVEIIYYCCGGSEGNETQLARYRREGLVKT